MNILTLYEDRILKCIMIDSGSQFIMQHTMLSDALYLQSLNIIDACDL